MRISSIINFRPKIDPGLIYILMGALLIRVIYLQEYSSIPDWEILTLDNWYCFNLAQDIASGNIFGDTTYFRAPFYIYCLSFLSVLFNSSLWVARIFGLVIGLSSISMTFLMGNKLFSRKTGLLAAIIHALYPIAYYFEFEILADSLFLLLFQIAIYRMLIWIERRNISDIFWTGFAVSLACITRPTGLVIIPLVLFFIVKYSKHQRIFKEISYFVLGLVIFIGPIFIRNIVIANDPVLIASQGGINFHIGNNPEADGYSARLPEPYGYNWRFSQINHIAEKESGQDLKPGEVSSYWANHAFEWIIENRVDFLIITLKKIGLQLINFEISNNRSLTDFSNKIILLKYNYLSFGFILLAASIGFILSPIRKERILFIISLMTIYIIAGSLFFISSRFRLPLLSLYFIFAAFGIQSLFRLSLFKPTLRYSALAIGVGAALFSFNPPINLSSSVNIQPLISQGLLAYNRTDFNKSLSLFKKARRLDPDYPEINLNIGAAFLRSGQSDSARFYFKEEIYNYPDRYKGYQNLASLELVSGNLNEARSFAGQALEIAPYSINSNIIYMRAISDDRAVSNSELYSFILIAADATNDDPFFLIETVIELLKRDDYKNCVTIANRTISADPPPIEINDQIYEEGFRYTNSQLDRNKAKAYFVLGFISGQHHNLTDAITYSSKAVSLDSNLVEAYSILLAGYQELGYHLKEDSLLDIISVRFPNHQLLQNRENK